MEGPDHKASLNPIELKQMVKAIRKIEEALGDGKKKPNKSEEIVKNVVRKRIVARKNLKAGEILNEDSFILKRANNGIFAENYKMIENMKLKKDIEEDFPITWESIIGE